jgi:hypothetical protein
MDIPLQSYPSNEHSLHIILRKTNCTNRSNVVHLNKQGVMDRTHKSKDYSSTAQTSNVTDLVLLMFWCKFINQQQII